MSAPETLVPEPAQVVPARERRSAVLRQGAGNMLLNLATLALNFALTLVLSHALGAAGFGAYSFAYAFAMVLSIPAMLGLTQLLVREISKYRVSESWASIRGLLRRANELIVVASVAIAVGAAVVIAATGWPSDELHRPTLLAVVLVPVVAITAARQGAMQGFGRVVLGRVPEAVVAPSLLLALCGVLFAARGHDFTATDAVAAAIVSFAVAAAIGALFLRRTLPAAVRQSTPIFQTELWLRLAVPLLALTIVQTLYAQSPTVLLGALGTSEDVGVYSVAAKVAGLLSFLLVAMMPALMPVVAELYARGDRDELQRVLTRSARIVLLASVPIAIVAIVFAGPILGIFGSSFEDGATALRILALGHIVNVCAGFPGIALPMIGDMRAANTVMASAALANVALSVALIPPFGASGAAAAMAVSLAASNVGLAGALWWRHRIYTLPFGQPRSR